MSVRPHTIFGFLTAAVSVWFFSGCVSFYAAGQFGHEGIPLPPPSPSGSSGPMASSWVSLEDENVSSLMTEDDSSLMGEASVLEVVQFPLDDIGAISLAAGAGGFFGVAMFKNAFSGAESAGLLPGEFPFYGGTFQAAIAADLLTPVLVGAGAQAVFSYESGPYTATRQLLSETPTDGSWAYVNLSQSGFSAAVLGFGRIGTPPRSGPGFTITSYYGFGDPDLLADEDDITLPFVPLCGVSLGVTVRRFLFYLNSEFMGFLNSGISLGMAYRVM